MQGICHFKGKGNGLKISRYGQEEWKEDIKVRTSRNNEKMSDYVQGEWREDNKVGENRNGEKI